jgi:hypothetical protein
MIKAVRNILLGTIALIATGVAQAIPVNYNESIDGDLNGTQLLYLDVGANTVIGAHQVTPGGATGNFDSWNFVLGTDLGISSIVFDYEDPQGAPNQYPNQGSFGITAPGNVLLEFRMYSGDFSYSDTFVGPLIATGNYLVELTGNYVYPSGSWTAVFNVVSTGQNEVPEPATLGLLGAGLLGLFVRRKKAA